MVSILSCFILISNLSIAIIAHVVKTYRIDKPVVDVYIKPDSRSEMVNQLLFNETVTASSEGENFISIKSEDGYTGWVRSCHLSQGAKIRHSHFVDIPVAALLDEKTGRFVGKLSFGTRITILESDESFGQIDFLGKPAWISLGCVKQTSRRKSGWRTIKSYLENLIGTPYLWGGRSGFGLDCSGLVQLVFNSCGYNFPRDSINQRKHGRKVALQNIKPGDLIFSPGHVCIYYGSGKIIHSSAQAGGVYIEDLLPDLPDSREDIYDKIEVVKRVV